MAILAGKDGSVKDSTTLVAHIDSWTMDQGLDIHEISALGDDAKAYVIGQRDTTAQIQGSFDSDDTGQSSFTDEIAAGAASHTVQLLYNSTSAAGFTGTAFVNTQSVGSSKDGKQSFRATVTFSGGVAAI